MLYIYAFFMHIYQFCFNHIDIKLYWFFSACFSLSLSLSLSLITLWHLNENPLCPETLFIPGRLLLLPLLILLYLTFGSLMIKSVRTLRRIFHDATFIRNAKLFYRTFLILTFLLSSVVGGRSHCVASPSLVLP